MNSENVSIKYSFGLRDSHSSVDLETFVREATIGWLSLFTLYLPLPPPCIVIIIIKISGQILAREWTKYECGVFSELGYKDDRLYPALFRSGNVSRPTSGTVQCLHVKLVRNCLVLSSPPSRPESCSQYDDKYQFKMSFSNQPCLLWGNFTESSAANSYITQI